jgi:hypothetical protein
MRGLISHLKALLRSGAVATDVSDELAYHLEREKERNVASGMSEDDAWYAAKRSIGNVGLHVETARDAWVGRGSTTPRRTFDTEFAHFDEAQFSPPQR